MRNSFISSLVEAARKDKSICLIVGDIGYSVVEPFADEFPDRFINAGVAEQNMAGLAAGMASEGFHVFCYSIANFPTFRCAEQIRNDICYHNLAVTIVAVGGGLAYGNLGFSHHATQDYALMRGMPNMTIAAPGDPKEVEACMNYIIKNPGPSYLRLGKAGEKVIHNSVPKLDDKSWQLLHNGNSNLTIVATGTAVQIALNFINNTGHINVNLYSIPIWNDNTKYELPQILQKTKKLLCLEDHQHDGGFGSWLLEGLFEAKLLDKINYDFIGLSKNAARLVGSEKTLLKECGLSNKNIIERLNSLLIA